jgi:hypothetical protein
LLDLGCEGIGVLREEEGKGEPPAAACGLAGRLGAAPSAPQAERSSSGARCVAEKEAERGESDGLAGRRRAAAEQRRAEEEERIEAGGERARQAWAAPAYDIDHRPDAGAEGARPR